MEPHVQILTAIIGVGVALAGLILRLSTRIDALDKRIDKTTDRLGQVEQGLAALKATVETFFRVRVDPPDSSPGSSPNAPPEDVQRRTGTDG
ncbi:MAG: hypothetical protein OXD47_04885 [Gammaproteobacteria bacterium]|nr:hypothetical protein [Gammaproteobacteria bacterium]MCY4210169.1 hypothetical protein [Gammaproteobacteria bacterium]MCY4282259.1 hypothetical protein [Gammaproteobacteria bacterium]MCY4338120.1 hypothetical protein [Gammaproteobacteria bacterium]